jgi:hypothetical protein
MMTRLHGFSGNIVGVSGGGRVTRGDYETVLIPAVQEALKRSEKVRLYYQIEPDFAGLEPAAMWEDFSIGVEHLTRWERIAVVTDVEWIRLAVQAFGFLMPGKVEIFALNEATRARAWVAAD